MNYDEKLLVETHVGPRFWIRIFAVFLDAKIDTQT